MIDWNTANVEIFDDHFLSREKHFADWLRTYLDKGQAYPFLMSNPAEYGLDDLLTALLLPAGEIDVVRIIKEAIATSLDEAAHSFELEHIRTLAYAVARSGLHSTTPHLAAAIDILVVELQQKRWDVSEKAAAHISVDQIVSALATFACAQHSAAIRCSRALYSCDVMAPFASILFAPLAIAEMESWPLLWRDLIHHSTRRSNVFVAPEDLFKEVHNPPQGKDGDPAYYDVFGVFGQFLLSAIDRGHGLQDIWNVIQGSNASDDIYLNAATAFYEMERRQLLGRTQRDDVDILFLKPENLSSPVNYNIKKANYRQRCQACVEPRSYSGRAHGAGRTTTNKRSELKKAAVQAFA
ncbi:hypothetical protein [Parvibaculum sp.]|uniref:hypothetical protein n=1 Tax=Parvibaculum sp. TaxID=2024848 RepID=UPI0034A0788F